MQIEPTTLAAQVSAQQGKTAARKSPERQPSNKQSAAKTKASSKQAKVLAMLQTPSGTTIAAMMKATKWQHHSLRGFLSAVIRKKLNLDLVSKPSDAGRIYRIKVARRRSS